jgi:hypothetical protein
MTSRRRVYWELQVADFRIVAQILSYLFENAGFRCYPCENKGFNLGAMERLQARRAAPPTPLLSQSFVFMSFAGKSRQIFEFKELRS